ncbi:MAG: hypothetical protein KDD68_20330, partial [Bdellovibrionales bacterium]|nr:hypothetical protein [Bdellovibrionales bacterium]
MRHIIVGVVAVVSLAVTIFIVGKVMNRPVKPDGVGRATGDVMTTFLNRKINFKSHSKTKGTDRKQSSQDVHDRASQIVVGRMGPWFESQTKLEGKVESETILRELAQDAEVVAVLKISLLDLD